MRHGSLEIDADLGVCRSSGAGMVIDAKTGVSEELDISAHIHVAAEASSAKAVPGVRARPLTR